VSPSFQFHSPASEIEASRNPYESLLQFLFGSGVGAPVTEAFKAFKIPIPKDQVASLLLSFLQRAAAEITSATHALVSTLSSVALEIRRSSLVLR
jgi:hypothetical protein